MQHLPAKLGRLMTLDNSTFCERATEIFADESLTKPNAPELVRRMCELKRRFEQTSPRPSREELELALAAAILIELGVESRAEGILHG